MSTSHDDLIDRSAYIHWPNGLDPDNADLFAHNAVVIDAPAESIWAKLAPAAQDVIRTPDQRVRVFVSSTLHELTAERQAARGRGDPAAAGAGDVRAGRPAAPAGAGIPGLPGAEPGLRGEAQAWGASIGSKRARGYALG